MSRMKPFVAAVLAICVCGCTVGVVEERSHPPGRAVGWQKRRPPAVVRLVLIGGTGIQFVADIKGDIFLHGGAWYKFDNGVWFQATAYKGPWTKISAPPAAFHKIPPGHAKAHVVKKGKAQPPGKGGKPKHKK